MIKQHNASSLLNNNEGIVDVLRIRSYYIILSLFLGTHVQGLMNNVA